MTYFKAMSHTFGPKQGVLQLLNEDTTFLYLFEAKMRAGLIACKNCVSEMENFQRLTKLSRDF